MGVQDSTTTTGGANSTLQVSLNRNGYYTMPRTSTRWKLTAPSIVTQPRKRSKTGTKKHLKPSSSHLANRAITHSRKFHNTEQLTKNFYQLAHLLREKLLCILFQLPPSIHKDLQLLQTIVTQLDPSVTNALEFRHPSWWDSEVYDLLQAQNLVFCCVSASGLPDEIVKTTDTLYVRFHGKNGWYQHNYPDDELAQWAEKITRQNPAKVLCYFNNDYNANATRNCLTLKKLLDQPQTSGRVTIKRNSNELNDSF